MQVRGWYVGNEPVRTNSSELQERLLDYERSSFGRMLDDFRKGLNARGSRLQEAEIIAAAAQAKAKEADALKLKEIAEVRAAQTEWEHRTIQEFLDLFTDPVSTFFYNSNVRVMEPVFVGILRHDRVSFAERLQLVLEKLPTALRHGRAIYRAFEIALQHYDALGNLAQRMEGAESDAVQFDVRQQIMERSALMLERVRKLLSVNDTISQQELARDTKETDEAMYEEIREYVGRINAVMQGKFKLNSWVEVHVGGTESVSVQLQRNLDALLPNETQTAGEGEVDYIHYLKQIIAEVASLEAKLSPEFVQTRKEVSE